MDLKKTSSRHWKKEDEKNSIFVRRLMYYFYYIIDFLFARFDDFFSTKRYCLFRCFVHRKIISISYFCQLYSRSKGRGFKSRLNSRLKWCQSNTKIYFLPNPSSLNKENKVIQMGQTKKTKNNFNMLFGLTALFTPGLNTLAQNIL
jgi:hypothetical protein